MSMYCTLPRSGHSSTANGQWLVQSGVNSNVLLIGSRSSVSSTDSVVNYVDKLFDPILNQESHYGDCSTIRSTGRPMSATSQLAEPESQQLSQQLSQQSSQLWPASASNLAANQHRQLNSSNARLYFAVDSFDDLKALRRSSAQLEASCMSLNSSNCDSASLIATTPPISDHQVPNFYGGVTEPETLNHHRGSQSSTASSTDSAYDSSNESLKVQLRKEPGPKTFAEYKKLVAQNNAQNGSSSKYFTLPSKLGRKFKKQLSESTVPTGSISGQREVNVQRRASIQVSQFSSTSVGHFETRQLEPEAITTRSSSVMGNTNRYRQDVLREQQLVTSMSSCNLASCNHTLPNSQVIQGPSSNHQDRLQGAPWLPPATGHEGHPVDHCCCMQGCHTGTSGPVPLASSWPVYATEGSYTRPPSQGWPRPGPSHSGSQASLVHCCSATSTHGSSPAPSCSLPSTPGSPSSASSGPGMALETLWEETGQVASQPAAVAVAMETIESPTIQMLQLKIRQLSSMVTSRDMEISRLKMALYTINAFGEEAKPPPGPSSNKGWLSKLGMNSSKSTAKPATRWRKGNQ